jgi:hypothetical protein
LLYFRTQKGACRREIRAEPANHLHFPLTGPSSDLASIIPAPICRLVQTSEYPSSFDAKDLYCSRCALATTVVFSCLLRTFFNLSLQEMNTEAAGFGCTTRDCCASANEASSHIMRNTSMSGSSGSEWLGMPWLSVRWRFAPKVGDY